ENGITFDGAIGVSAGAAFGCNFKSKQIGRPLRYNKKYCKDWRYCSMKSLLLTGDLFGAKFCYHDIPMRLDPFDNETYVANPMPFYLVATNVETGRAVYHEVKTGIGRDLKWFQASASMPVVSRPVEIDGHYYMDGGTADSIPQKYFESIGYTHNVVILTQPKGYVKKPGKNQSAMKLMLRKYPKLWEALESRPQVYNETLAYIEAEEAEGKTYVVRPPESLGIGHTSKDPDELQRVYDIGRKVGEEKLEEIRAFLGE
ncbi:MAG: patatin family protein, partial [Lachnospiraceae bacterium]|nr:patatin family protein [Candidatus Equihabitans merdae]